MIKVTDNFIEQQLSSDAEALGLTSGQMHILHFVCKNRETGVCQRKIEDFFQLSHATVAGIVARLENKQFIYFVASEDDKRYKSLFPTEKAIKYDNEMQKCIENAEKRFFAGFSDDEKNELRDYLKRILINLGVELPKKEDKI